MTTESQTRGLLLMAGAISLATCLTTHAQAKPIAESSTRDQGATDQGGSGSAYGEKGAVELGGAIGMNWTNDAFKLDVSPSIGYFIMDRVQLSALIRVSYEDQKRDDGNRDSVRSGALIFEPSYHFPAREELFVFAGLGMGVGHDDEDFDLEFIPRVGLNIGIDLIGIVTPSLKMPILVDNDGTSAGLGLELAYSVVW